MLRPVRALTGDATQLLIAPDGALNLLPFETLVDERGRFQVQRYAISYLSSGRDVLRMQVPRVRAGPPLVLADPAFGEGQTGVRPGSDQGQTPVRAEDRSLVVFRAARRDARSRPPPSAACCPGRRCSPARGRRSPR